MVYPETPPHGTKQRYRRGCKCELCRDAEARYERKRVHAHNHGVRLRVDPVGARRRVEALQVMAYTQKNIAEASGLKPGNLSRMIRRDQVYIFRSTHDAIAATYNRLSMTFGPSELSRKVALQRGYLPPLAWDDETIDNPDAKPYPIKPALTEKYARHYIDEVLVQRALAGHKVKANRVERLEIIRRWQALGRGLNTLDDLQNWHSRRDLKQAG